MENLTTLKNTIKGMYLDKNIKLDSVTLDRELSKLKAKTSKEDYQNFQLELLKTAF